MDIFCLKEQAQKLMFRLLDCCQFNFVIWQWGIFCGRFMSCVRLPMEQFATQDYFYHHQSANGFGI